jgi:hypothetical protein
MDKEQLVAPSSLTIIGDGRADEAETGAFLALVSALRPLPESARTRVINAVLAFIGASPMPMIHNAVIGYADSQAPSLSHDEAGELPRRASVWISQTNLSLSDVDSVFHRTSGGVDLIAHSVPGKSNKERVRSCYLLSGVQGLLKSGEARFADEDARQICRELGCYDKANHATYVKALGNLVTGTKSTSY